MVARDGVIISKAVTQKPLRESSSKRFPNNNGILSTKIDSTKIRKIKGLSLEELEYFEFPKIRLKNLGNPAPKMSLKDFQVGSLLGRGRFGTVNVARHRPTGILVALKKISKSKARMMRAEARIVSELRIHQSLDHPNVLKFYGYFNTKSSIYFVLELASEGSLFDIVKRKRKKALSEEKTAEVVKQVLRGVAYLHGKSFIHRDIKPENILISLVSGREFDALEPRFLIFFILIIFRFY